MERHSFWPIVQRVKERWSLKNDSVIHCNVTEGIPSFPPVESMVTAYHAESKVTDCHAMRGTRSSGDDIREGDAILAAAMDDEDFLKGFQHLYKSTKTTSSLRVLAAHKATKKYGVARNYYARRRDRKKNTKTHDVEKVKPSPQNMMNMRNDPSSKVVFFSGTSERKVPNQVNNSIVRSAITDMRVVDTVDGARMDLAPEENIFVLIPRKAAIKFMSNVNKTLLSMSALNKAKGFAEKRGNKRITATEGKNSNYVTVGLKPNRGSHGILDSWPHKLSATDKKQILKFMNQCQEVANGYIKSQDLRGIQMAKLILKWRSIKGCGPASIWPSFSQALNTYLSAHTDDDFFYSLLTTACSHALRDDIDQYKLHAEVSNFFVFPEQGIAVALRPGDMLIFNPKYHHCLSSRTCAYQNKDVYSMSLYLKSAVVGKNDNSIPLNDKETDLLRE